MLAAVRIADLGQTIVAAHARLRASLVFDRIRPGWTDLVERR
ncbi:MAG: hypothetical protein ACXWMU_02495 [Candidatus Limnocylindrales bacterium]